MNEGQGTERIMEESLEQIELGKYVKVEICRLSEKGTVAASFTVQLKWLSTITVVRNVISQRTGLPHDCIFVVSKGKVLPKSFCLYQLDFENRHYRLYYYSRPVGDRTDTLIQVMSPFALSPVLFR